MRSLSDVPARPVRTASIANLGCKVNQSEIDTVERLLRACGVRLVDSSEAADLVVVNTCAVTGIADQKSRHAVRRARRLNPDAATFVTGCSVQLDRSAFSVADPDATLFDNDSKTSLLGRLAELVGEPDGGHVGTAGRIERTRAYVKVQDGCSFHCTYCVVPLARGAQRSAGPQTVLDEIRRAVGARHREIVLTGINVGAYEGDGGGDRAALSLAGLVRRILDETAIERIRLSSIEPQHVDADLLDVWTSSGGRCLPHFHVPLQSGDDRILRRMGRRYTALEYEAVLARIRERVPEAAVHADVMAGFPGEDDAAWQATLDLLRRSGMAGFHVFRFSARPGTPAARMAGQLDAATRKRRAAEGLAVAAEARAAFARRQLGRQLDVLFESQLPDGAWVGHAGNHTPVAATRRGGGSLENVIARVRAEVVDAAEPGRVRGTILAL